MDFLNCELAGIERFELVGLVSWYCLVVGVID